MRGVFDERDTERPEHGQDRELTLGSGALLALFAGLVVLCGLCFGIGYAAGHGGSQTAAVNTPKPATEQEPLQASGSIPKPSAIAQNPVAVAPQDAAAPDQLAATSGAPDGQAAAPEAAPAALNGSGNAPQVHPALASGGNLQNYSAGAAQAVHPAFSSQPFVVQIAAVSNPNDAEVLVAALRKRNYPVLARREPADNFIHVRIGPFASRAIAEQWRMKLLNDGYNAEIQP